MAGGDYGRIRHTFWTDPDIKRSLSIEQKALLLYYFTSPHSSLIGLYYCPFGYVAVETGIPIERVRSWTLGELSRYVSYDEDTDEVFVHRAGRHQVGDDLKPGDKRVKAIQKAVSEAHSPRLVASFLEMYPGWPLGIAPPEVPPSKGLTKGLRSQSIAVTEQEQSKAAAEGLAGGSDGSVDPDLDTKITSLVIVCNRGMGDNPLIRRDYEPILPSNGRSRQAAADLLAEGIPYETIAHVIYEGAKAYKPSDERRQIASLNYFRSAVREEHMRRSAKSASVPGGPVYAPPTTSADALETLRTEHPEVYADAVAELEGYHWWESTTPSGKIDEIRKLVRDKLARPRIVA